MEESRSEVVEQNTQDNLSTKGSGDASKNIQHPDPNTRMQNLSGVDISRMDQQEGNMDNGTLGGNFNKEGLGTGKEDIRTDYSDDSPSH